MNLIKIFYPKLYFSVLPALIAAGATIGATHMANRASAKGQRDANDANAEEAQKNRDFQERMSSTAFQRGVADAKAAGFNPLAAFPHPATTPMGSTPTMLNEKPNRGEIMNHAASVASDIMLKRELANTEKTKQVINHENAKTAAATAKIAAQDANIKTGRFGKAVGYISRAIDPIRGVIGGSVNSSTVHKD